MMSHLNNIHVHFLNFLGPFGISGLNLDLYRLGLFAHDKDYCVAA